MAFYTELKKYVDPIENVFDNPIKSAFSFTTEQKKFLLYAIPKVDDKKSITKIITGCIKYEIWGFLYCMISDYSSYKGVDTLLINNFDRIPDELKASILSIECLGNKWTNKVLNDLFIKSLVENRSDLPEMENESDVIQIYFPLGWNENYEDAVNTPCWFIKLTDAISYCMYTQMYYSKNNSELNTMMFGDGELHGPDTIKTRILIASINKSDILARFKPSDVSENLMGMDCVIQNRTVFDISELDPFEVMNEELNFLEEYLKSDIDDIDYTDIIDKSIEIHDEINISNIRAGVPERLSVDIVNNKVLTDPKDLAQLIRVRVNTKQGEAIRIAKGIQKSQGNVNWIYGSSDGYKQKKGYFYRGLCFSPYKNHFFIALFRYNGNKDLDIVVDEEKRNFCNGIMEVIAVDFSSEAKTYQECYKKCITKDSYNPKEEKNTDYQIKYVKEELSSEEKEAIKNQYREEVDSEYQKEIQIHKDSADSKANELEILKIKYEKLLRENKDLKKQLDKKQSILDKQNVVSVLSMGKEKEKYDGETHAIVLSAIRHELKNCDRDTRRHDVLESVLEKNMDDNDPISDKLAEIKRITKGYRIASEMKPGLIKQGFQYTEDGRHPKIQYPDDDRYIITAASTTSDTRAGENLYALIKKKFF